MRPLVLVWVVGCAIDEPSDYATARAEAECGRIERCELGRFESQYNSLDDCVGEVEDQIREGNQLQNDLDCEYVPEEAGLCVRRIRGMACEEWAEGEVFQACDLVWDCITGRT